MTERLDELLRRMASKEITAAERAELASLLNTPVTGPFEGLPPLFVSKNRFRHTDVGARVAAIGWFSHCGEPLSLDLTMEVEPVANWPAAVRACKSRDWENATLEARNQLTMWLHTHQREKYRGWNEFVKNHKKVVINPLAQSKLRPYLRRHRLPDDVLHAIRWDILGALMENEYLKTGHPVYFFLELLTVYETGHFPCGWQGEWPQGKLLVY